MNNPVIKEFDANGTKYVYDFEKMDMEQIIMAETLFRIHDKMFQVLPGVPSDIEKITNQMAIKHAYALLLTKINPDGTPEEFNPATTNNLDALRKLRGGKYRRDLEECKDDFFLQSGLVTDSSMMPLKNLTSVLGTLSEAEKDVIYKLVANSSAGLTATSSELNSIPPELSPTGPDISEIPTSSGLSPTETSEDISS